MSRSRSVLAAFLLVPTLALADPGRRIDLGDGATLFVPDGFRPEGDRVDVLLHLHGAPTTIEPAFVAAGWRGVLVAFNRKGLSSAYAAPFADPSLFPRLLDAARDRAGARRVGRVVVSSFSAGFGGVRELLKVPAHRDRIDALIMADSLYAGYAGDPAGHRVDPTLMEGFRWFAAEAAEGRKTFLLTHSAQVPEGYASTTETADFLIRSLGGHPEVTSIPWGDGWTQTRRFARGRFLVLGFEGAGADDHLRHLRRIERIWRALPGALQSSP